MAKIYIVEDDRTISDLLEIALRHEGHQICLDPQGELSDLDDTFDLLLLDLTLPSADGLDLARRIRAAYDLPIIMITARGEVHDRIAGFEAGADDYLPKPFSFDELTARIRAVLKRAGRAEGRLRAGPLTLDLEQRRVWYGAGELPLTPREFDVLAALMRRPGRVYSREDLLNRVWGIDFAGESNVVEATIRRVREKLGPEGQRMVATVRGSGYTLRTA
jgi:DNA-binding response OmpR family regulator